MATHHFKPTHYHRALGPYEPVLRIASGDTVITTTIDAFGHDELGDLRVRGNAQTGPFYIESAMPGDTLKVHLDKLWPNRTTGYTSTVVAPHVVDPEYVKETPDDIMGEWELDLEAGTARLVKPETKMANLRLPLRPMLGCFGVAPRRKQAISTATSDTHGGNMDYKGFVAGVDVFFPVFEEGALFFVGDGHAIQGDGEIVGNGIEVSFDVQFTVEVIKEKTIKWPRVENDTHIITLGNARPLEQALQHATTEMLRWLQTDYGFDARTAHALMGQCVEYEIGNVFDPAYTIACKISKDLLVSLSAQA